MTKSCSFELARVDEQKCSIWLMIAMLLCVEETDDRCPLSIVEAPQSELWNIIALPQFLRVPSFAYHLVEEVKPSLQNFESEI